MSAFKDLSGQRFGRLLVIDRATPKSARIKWNCVCDCGKYKAINGSSLRLKRSKSCGCLAVEGAIKSNTKHGLTETPEYNCWQLMKARCYRKTDKSYLDYGGRGVTVCDRWQDSFKNFIADVGRKPSKDHSIDRINNDGNYEPSNCRWATSTQQNRNKRVFRKNRCGVTGVRWTGSKWYSAIRVNKKAIHLYCGDDFEAACRTRKAGEERYWTSPTPAL